ncbi:phage terminase small subunit P27 family [Metabacillus litoralis]|uniref:phage terminase small subunit P27 family n=1 Tax=Metabacillus litoralis TaxID=152268 RepID=UPI002041C0B4|nr:phage terminase small subunit P27 family [Metabacillus litoralis]MCM3411239.1 phage terminase small subunit P27 family [Metabacillus litoralis]
MGRARQPVDLLVYKGNKNLTRQEIEERKSQEIKASTDKVKPPTHLPRELKREFKKIANELVRIGIMTNLDNDALARFLLARKMYLEVTDTLISIPPTDKIPYTKKDEYGEIVEEGMRDVVNETYSELLINQDKLFKQCRSAASDLGLTIASRCKLVIPKSPESNTPQSKEQKMFGDRL